jgi:hypothetical protein
MHPKMDFKQPKTMISPTIVSPDFSDAAGNRQKRRMFKLRPKS